MLVLLCKEMMICIIEQLVIECVLRTVIWDKQSGKGGRANRRKIGPTGDSLLLWAILSLIANTKSHKVGQIEEETPF